MNELTMKHQLKPNTYTICESTEQYKELFEWAKANGVKTDGLSTKVPNVLDWADGELCAWHSVQTAKVTSSFIPLPEFIARLKGEWVEGKTVTLSDKDWTRLDGILNGERFDEDYVEWLQATIKEQLNNQ